MAVLPSIQITHCVKLLSLRARNERGSLTKYSKFTHCVKPLSLRARNERGSLTKYTNHRLRKTTSLRARNERGSLMVSILHSILFVPLSLRARNERGSLTKYTNHPLRKITVTASEERAWQSYQISKFRLIISVKTIDEDTFSLYSKIASPLLLVPRKRSSR